MALTVTPADLATPLGPDYPLCLDVLDEAARMCGGVLHGRKIKREIVRVPSPSGQMMQGAALVYC